MTQATLADLTSTGLLARVLTRAESNTAMRVLIGCWLAATIAGTPVHGAFAEMAACRQMAHAGNGYTVCEVDLRKRDVRLFWKRPDGAPYAYLSALPRSLDGESGKLSFAINAGMFDPALKP